MRVYMRYPGGKPKALTFSYDDGVEQDIRLVGILNSHGMKGTFNLNSGLFAPEGTVYPAGTIHRRMTEKMCGELYANHEVALHGLTHPYLEALPREQCAYEILRDRENLERLTGKITRGMAYPFGTFSDGVVEALKSCGIAYSRTVIASEGFELPKDWLRLEATCHHGNRRLTELAERFVNLRLDGSRTAKLFYLWGHAYEFEANDNWSIIENFTDYMAGREDIWYATNIEIYDYIEAYKSLRFNLALSSCYNPTAYELFFTGGAGNRMYSVKPGETIALD